MKLYKRNRLVFGVGINDADYNVMKYERINGKQKRVWSCPYYIKWTGMLERCYSELYHARKPTYAECRVVSEWLTFSTFKTWMQAKYWEGKELDKDILFPGNKVYGPDKCVFVDTRVNTFINENISRGGPWPVGVSWSNDNENFVSRGRCVLTGKRKHLGCFINPQEAHQAWLSFKLEQAYILAAEQIDERVAKALIDRYENYSQVMTEKVTYV